MNDRSRQHEKEPAEADHRFPSGPWVGFWLQKGCQGRQWMRDLWLQFAQGQVKGGGADWIGEFTFRGRYDLDTGKCTLYKDYVDAHTVTYQGQNEGDGLWLWGMWSIQPAERGGFHLWPKGENDPTEHRLTAEKDVSAVQTESCPAGG